MILMTLIFAIVWVVAVVLLYGMVSRGQTMQYDLALLEQFISAIDGQPETDSTEQVSS